MNKMKTLIIVDFQFDFFNKKGALYVNDAEKAEKKARIEAEKAERERKLSEKRAKKLAELEA